MTLRLDVAYDGTPFHGFARQPGLATVQGEIEGALGSLFGTEIATVAAGRTDAGVHALGQVLSAADHPVDLDVDRTRAALNGMCQPSISVSRCAVVGSDFNARFNARSRMYSYAILTGPVPDPFLSRTALWHPAPLDVAAMNEAAGHLVGDHDFASFGRAPEGGTTVRNLFELRCRSTGPLVRIRARANAFIQQMVRSLVGTLVQIGEGRRSPDEARSILEARDRAAAGPVAAPHGLCLVAVEYDEGWSHPV